MDDFELETPDMPDFPEVSDLPDLSDSPEIVEIPDAPDIPERPPERGSPDNPNLPGRGDMPESPELSGRGDMPDSPEFPGRGDMPESPELPGRGEIPESPELPGRGEIPESPELPGRGEMPESPELPGRGELPESPELPGRGEIPDSHNAFPTDKPEGQSSETKPEAIVSSAEAVTPSIEGTPDPISTGTKPETIHPENEVQPVSMEPNSTYERNGYECQTNEFGHTRLVTGDLKLEQGDRTHLQTEVGHMGLAGDEGGHLVGTRFDGPTDAFNLVPQNANLNRGEWKAMENSWADNLAQGKDVKVMIEPIYNGNAIRPESFDVLSQVNGELTYTSFQNQARAASPKEK